MKINKHTKYKVRYCSCYYYHGHFETCKFHKECHGSNGPCAPGISICSNPKHENIKLIYRKP